MFFFSSTCSLSTENLIIIDYSFVFKLHRVVLKSWSHVVIFISIVAAAPYFTEAPARSQDVPRKDKHVWCNNTKQQHCPSDLQSFKFT